MAETFTGLKLQGELGRFGKTEITDIVGIYPMPDEKVISGSEWGNLLVWEAGLIKIEVFKTLRRYCHRAPVMQFVYNHERKEIWSIAQDGWTSAWSYRVIDEADPPDEDRVVQVIPSYERENPGVQFMCIAKKKLYNANDPFYYAQDGNGGILLIDLTLQMEYTPPKKLFSCHAGAVVALAVCPWGPYLFSLGEDGHAHIYNYLTRTLIFAYKFSAKGRALLWLPLSVDSSGSFVITGFDDGVIRVCYLSLKKEDNISLTLVQSTKPHNKPVTLITMNPDGTIFVSAGEDNTLFVYAVEKSKQAGILLKPIGYVNISSTATCFTWHPRQPNTLLVGCMQGQLLEYNLPEAPMDYTDISYLLYTVQPLIQNFTTCKSQIRRDQHLQEVETRKAEKLIRKKEELAKIKAENPGLEIDEEAYLLDSESDEVLEPLHIPEIPNRIWFAKYTPENTIWLSMGGYDAGYIYEYQMDQTTKEPLKATLIEDGDDIEMHGYLYSYDGKYLIISMENGAIRFNRENLEDFRDLSDYWLLSMHDNFNGHITSMCFSYDHKYFFSSGADGNIFSYLFKPEDEIVFSKPTSIRSKPSITAITKDASYDSPSLEEKMIKAEEEKQLALANEHKRKLRLKLEELTKRLDSILERNCALPKSQRYLLKDFVIDERIMEALDEKLEGKVTLEKRKLAFDVEKSTVGLRKMQAHYTDIMDVFPIAVNAVNKPDVVYTLAQRSLGPIFYDMQDKVAKKLLEEQQKGRIPERDAVAFETGPDLQKRQLELEPFLIGLSPSTIAFKLGAKITRLLNKYRERRLKNEKRQEDWNKLNARKPVEGANHPDDEKAIEIAKLTIGDYKLKTAPDYRIPEALRESTVKKFEQLLDARLTAYKTMVHAFNMAVYSLRDKKVAMVKQLEEWSRELEKIQKKLPERKIFLIPDIPEMSSADFPEANLEVVVDENVESIDKRSEVIKSFANEEEDASDLEEQVLDWNTKMVEYEGSIEEIYMAASDKFIVVDDPENIDILLSLGSDENIDTPWEAERRVNRFFKKYFKQLKLISQMEKIVEDFDKEVKELHGKGLDVAVDANFMDLYLLLLNQELVIVKDFETVELDLRNKVRERINEMLDMRDNIARIENKIEGHHNIINRGVERTKELQQLFTNATKDSAFFDFLRRIFKKKYKPPRVFDPDESESSSVSSDTSTESDEGDAFSLESGEIGPIRLDENVCPKGCDRQLYDYTFSLRSQRHDIEKQAKEEVKNIEVLKKEMEIANKKLKTIDIAVNKCQVELEEFQRIKQTKLNALVCTVILHLSQMQHFDSETGTDTDINTDSNEEKKKSADVLVFNARTLSKLYARVGELQMETLEERAKHNKNKIHLHRMNVDCKYMQEKILQLKKKISDTMKEKFGRKINVDEVEEAVLKRLVMNLRLSLAKINSLYDKDLKTLKEAYAVTQTETAAAIQENTARLELLDILTHEKAELIRLLKIQRRETQKTLEKVDFNFNFIQDINKLKKISHSQLEQVEALKSEIKMLSSKSIPVKAESDILHTQIPTVDLENLPEIEKEEFIMDDLESFDEFYVKPEQQIQFVALTEEDITEKDIISCVEGLITEIIESATSREPTAEKIITKIISDMLEQIPSEYLLRDDSLKQIKSILNNAVNLAMEQVDSSKIVTDVLSSTSIAKAEDIVHSILELILPKE